MSVIVRWLINAGTLLLLAYYLPGIGVSGIYAALIAALILGLINAVIRPLLMLLTLPINIITLGLFTLVINAFLFWFVSTFVQGFSVTGVWPAFWGAIVMSLVSWLTSSLFKK